MDIKVFEEYLEQLADRYTASELVEELNLDVWEIIEMFRDRLEEGFVRPDRYDLDEEG